MQLQTLTIILALFIQMEIFSETPGICRELSRQESVYEIALPIKFILSDTSLTLRRDNELVLSIITVASKRILHISFNGDEGMDGTLRIYSVSSKLMKEANFELIRYPYYASLDITEFISGTYRAELNTKKGIHTCVLIVK
jgi:hypothetical protein